MKMTASPTASSAEMVKELSKPYHPGVMLTALLTPSSAVLRPCHSISSSGCGGAVAVEPALCNLDLAGWHISAVALAPTHAIAWAMGDAVYAERPMAYRVVECIRSRSASTEAARGDRVPSH